MTAIVIGFALFALWLYLLFRVGKIDTEDQNASRRSQEILAHIRDNESPNLNKED